MFSSFLSGCTAKEEKQTYFVHGASFVQCQEGIEANLLLERLSRDKSKYFTLSVEAKDLSEAAEELKKKYKECYFATCRFYLIEDNADGEFLTEFATELCGGNDFPLTADVFCTKSCSGKEIIEKIETGDDLTALRAKISGKSVNVIRFLSRFTMGRSTSLTSLTISQDGKIKPYSKAVFKKGEDVRYEKK